MSDGENGRGFDQKRSDRSLNLLLMGLGGLFIVFLLIVLFVGRA
jgi:hypothetical protein